MTSTVSEPIDNAILVCSSEKEIIEGIIAELRAVIDQIGNNLTNARKLILELARRFDENKVHEQSQISIKIKEVLQDKIKEGKISEVDRGMFTCTI